MSHGVLRYDLIQGQKYPTLKYCLVNSWIANIDVKINSDRPRLICHGRNMLIYMESEIKDNVRKGTHADIFIKN